jgi:Ca-activated chloride channel family protein
VKSHVSIILVSDGLETCDGNACSLVKEARANGIDITMHVIGFGITETDQSSLECLAQAGNGQYVPAANAEELAAALAHSVEELPHGNAFISIHTTMNGQLKDASITITSSDKSINRISGRTYESAETNPRLFCLPAGTYTIDIAPVRIDGYQSLIWKDIRIEPDDTLYKEASFEQGIFEIGVTRNGALSDATIQVMEPGTTRAIATTRSYTQATHNPAKLKVPPGTYDIVIGSVEISGRPQVMIRNQILGGGQTNSLSHDFKSGEVLIGASQGSALVDATINIHRQSDHQSVGAGRTYQSASSNPKAFILEPGQYTVEISSVKPAGLGKKTLSFEVETGKSKKIVAEW